MPLNHPETGARLRYLPPGSLRRQRRRGRLEGAGASLVLTCLIGFALIAVAPAEMYRPAPATILPIPSELGVPIEFVQLPPCLGQGKDCEVLPPLDPSSPTRPVPEPGTLSLVVAAVALLTWRRKS